MDGGGGGVLVTITNRQEERPAMIMNCQFHPPAFTSGQPRQRRSREDALWTHAVLTNQAVSSAADSPGAAPCRPLAARFILRLPARAFETKINEFYFGVFSRALSGQGRRTSRQAFC